MHEVTKRVLIKHAAYAVIGFSVGYFGNAALVTKVNAETDRTKARLDALVRTVQAGQEPVAAGCAIAENMQSPLCIIERSQRAPLPASAAKEVSQ